MPRLGGAGVREGVVELCGGGGWKGRQNDVWEGRGARARRRGVSVGLAVRMRNGR